MSNRRGLEKIPRLNVDEEGFFAAVSDEENQIANVPVSFFLGRMVRGLARQFSSPRRRGCFFACPKPHAL
jgi:hypothetical protein